MAQTQLGIVVQGSLSQGLEVRLSGDVAVEELRVGQFLVVQGRRNRFFLPPYGCGSRHG
nr:hypothetical protein [Thermostichus lividus]